MHAHVLYAVLSFHPAPTSLKLKNIKISAFGTLEQENKHTTPYASHLADAKIESFILELKYNMLAQQQRDDEIIKWSN